ncbi:uncharacterized protein LOC121855376 isoform X1 [Homarus americanus]|uniref:uncharacterized protein LOC121855376 isoform X1 n=1 Tax=Homarus americanus TaxID=6706 RepID=UPI001C43E367|nr:uncharacterized protein LOC121855376 isoform X1 [Homarus americanus]
MADLPNVDLFSEIYDLSMYVNGKSEGKFDFFGIDENIELNTGIPSHGLMDNDAMLAVDSSNALLGDPLLNLFDQNDLLELQSAVPSHTPETLMPVSLPAGTPSHPSASDVYPHLQSCSPAEGSPTHSSHPGGSELRSSAPSSRPTPDSEVKRTILVTSGGTGACSPYRIVVKTRKQPVSKMVAPLSLQKPSHNLVKIPKVGSTAPVVRMQAIRSGGKLGPLTQANITRTCLIPPAVATNHQSVPGQDQATSGCSSGEATVPREHHPFRSLRVKRLSETSDGSQTNPTEEQPCRSLRVKRLSGTSDSSECSSSGQKRKAYELEPQPNPHMERCRQNAINAKRNRDMKKARMADLERKVEDVSRERDQLAGENESLREAKLKLEQQVKHLNNILKNQSKLSSLIGKLSPSSVILGDMSSNGSEDDIITSGMCLHVDGEEATIEYCSYCAKKAGKKIGL